MILVNRRIKRQNISKLQKRKHKNILHSCFKILRYINQRFKLCQRMQGPVFPTCLIGFTVQLSWRMMMNQVGWKNFVEKPPTFVPSGKSLLMRGHFCRTTINPPLFSSSSLQLTISVRVCSESESTWELFWALFGRLFVGRWLFYESSDFWPAWNMDSEVLWIVLCDFQLSEKKRKGDISDIWKG